MKPHPFVIMASWPSHPGRAPHQHPYSEKIGAAATMERARNMIRLDIEARTLDQRLPVEEYLIWEASYALVGTATSRAPIKMNLDRPSYDLSWKQTKKDKVA